MHRPFRSLPLAVWAGRVHLVRAWRSAAGDRPLRTRSMMERQGLVTADSPIALDHSLHTLDHEDPKPMEAHDSSAKKGRILSPRLDKEGRQAGTHRQHEAYGKTRPLLLHMRLPAGAGRRCRDHGRRWTSRDGQRRLQRQSRVGGGESARLGYDLGWELLCCQRTSRPPAGGGRCNASSSVVSFGAVFDTTGSYYLFHAAEGMKHALRTACS
jgi:hypothetical protein